MHPSTHQLQMQFSSDCLHSSPSSWTGISSLCLMERRSSSSSVKTAWEAMQTLITCCTWTCMKMQSTSTASAKESSWSIECTNQSKELIEFLSCLTSYAACHSTSSTSMTSTLTSQNWGMCVPTLYWSTTSLGCSLQAGQLMSSALGLLVSRGRSFNSSIHTLGTRSRSCLDWWKMNSKSLICLKCLT